MYARIADNVVVFPQGVSKCALLAEKHFAVTANLYTRLFYHLSFTLTSQYYYRLMHIGRPRPRVYSSVQLHLEAKFALQNGVEFIHSYARRARPTTPN